ncbi:hypothetical protein VB796_14700 [Arcicella sp. LKC2W]|jgi:hypothetical protein|uniref:hypothetical protein n=1 Tax=Arcicella sp. LKC2W TaxID=2984198 RepID=UPI002B1F25CB|nr:hypothetical protein [Arcicella sp. LKC2W]MEA5460302.1 hypothetical protein [Arcicella sp. LKC2W]
MGQLILRVEDVQKVLNVCRTEAYRIIKDIKADCPYSNKLKGGKVRTEDLAETYGLKVEDIHKALI